MAALDYVVRRNNANTDTIPNTGSTLVTLWDTSVASVGSISYASGVFTLGETGRYLVIWSDQYGTTSTTNNERLNVRSRLRLGGSFIVPGRASGYIRKSDGSQEFINSGFGIIEVTSTVGTADELELVHDRVDNTTGTGEEPDRIADRSAITIIKLDDDHDFARYTVSSNTAAPSGDGTSGDFPINNTVEEDTGFSRSGNDVTITTAGRYLVTYSIPLDGTSSAARTEFTSHIELDSVAVPGTQTETYIRTTDNTDDGCLSWGGIIDVAASDVLTTVLTRRDGETSTINILAGASIEIWKLPVDAEVCIVEATTGNFNAATTDFSWDTIRHIDTAAFTHTAGNSNVEVDVADDYIVFASQAVTSLTAASRAVPAMGLKVNTTLQNIGGGSTYNRNSGTAGYGAINGGGLLTGLSIADDIIVNNDRLGTVTTTHTCGSGQLSVVRLGSLAPSEGISSVSPTEFDMDDGDVDVSGLNFGATQGTGTVYISDADTLAGSVNEVEIANGINTWADTLINLDLTGLNDTEISNLNTLGPGTRYVIVVTNGSDEYGSDAITLHRAEAFKMSLGAGTPGATTARLTAPATKTTADFDAGRFEEAANPATAVDITADDYTEMVWSIEANTLARDVSYDFRVTISGTALDTYTVTPQVTISAAATLEAGAASYSWTGTAANLEYHSVVSAAAGSYAWTGTAANLEYQSVLTAEAGSYAWAGQAASLEYNVLLDADAGSYAWTGTAANLEYNRILSAEAASYSWAGTAADLLRSFLVSAQATSYAWSGQDATLTYVQSLTLAADPTAYTWTGTAASLELHSVLVADTTSYNWTGQAAALEYAALLSAESGSYTWTGTAATLIRDATLTAETTAYNWSGQDAGLVAGFSIAADTTSYAWTGQTATLIFDALVSAEAAAYAWSGTDATLTYVQQNTIVAGAASYVWSGQEAAFLYDRIMSGEAGSYVWSGSDAGLSVSVAGLTPHYRGFIANIGRLGKR